MLKYHNKTITLLEVPGETALVYSIMGCPMKCKGCHSKHLWKTKGGEELSTSVLNSDLYLYRNMITAVCFMGGEWEEASLIDALDACKAFGLKTCLYTGLPAVSDEIESRLDFLKIGAYEQALGGLDSKTTNQRFFAIKESRLVDQTHLFQQEH